MPNYLTTMPYWNRGEIISALVVDSKLMSCFHFTVRLSFTCDFTNNLLCIQASPSSGGPTGPIVVVVVGAVAAEAKYRDSSREQQRRGQRSGQHVPRQRR